MAAKIFAPRRAARLAVTVIVLVVLTTPATRHRIAQPTLLVWGDADPISPVAVGQRLAAVLPNARLLVVPGGDHAFARDRAAEVAGRIGDFLGRSP